MRVVVETHPIDLIFSIASFTSPPLKKKTHSSPGLRPLQRRSAAGDRPAQARAEAEADRLWQEHARLPAVCRGGASVSD